MKKVTLLLVCTALTLLATAQPNAKYTSRMTALVAEMDTARTADQLTRLAIGFERVANAEKKEWLPYYYAALCNINAAYASIGGKMGDNTAITDPTADKAEAQLNSALALTKENSETWLIKKQLASLRMMGNPMARYMEYGKVAEAALATALKLDANNPRVYILQARDKYYTPEQFGGSKAEGKKLFGKAVDLFKVYKPETALHPNWGLGEATMFANIK